MECPECKNKLLLAIAFVDEFLVDDEPYESGIEEEGEIMQGFFATSERLQVCIHYCEKCDKIIKSWIEDKI